MCFENITYAPIDLDAIDPDEMTGREKKLLNDYHKKVYETISPYLNEDEKEWLKHYTRSLS
jgi:Xaa-Pro aminopeptidase